MLKDLFSRRKDRVELLPSEPEIYYRSIEDILNAGCKIPTRHIKKFGCDAIVFLLADAPTQLDTNALYEDKKILYIIEDNVTADLTKIDNAFCGKTGELKLTSSRFCYEDIQRIVEEREGNIDLVKNFYHGDLYDFAKFLSKACSEFNNNTVFCNAQADALLKLYTPKQLQELIDEGHQKISNNRKGYAKPLPRPKILVAHTHTNTFFDALCSTLEQKLSALQWLERKVQGWRP